MVSVNKQTSTASSMSKSEFNAAFYGENPSCTPRALPPSLRRTKPPILQTYCVTLIDFQGKKITFYGDFLPLSKQNFEPQLYHFRARYFDTGGMDPWGLSPGMVSGQSIADLFSGPDLSDYEVWDLVGGYTESFGELMCDTGCSYSPTENAELFGVGTIFISL